MKYASFIPDEACRFILFQRTELITFKRKRLSRFARKWVPFFSYEQLVNLEAIIRRQAIKAQYAKCMQNEYEIIRGYLPEECEGILDIGCGIGGIVPHLDKHYDNQNVEYFLLDRTQVDKGIYYMFEEKAAFYNSLDIARKYLTRCGIKEKRLHMVEAKESNAIDLDITVDCALSLLSWGFHYPISTYLDSVEPLLNDGGVLIVDVRKGTGGVELLADRFASCQVVLEKPNRFRVCAKKMRCENSEICGADGAGSSPKEVVAETGTDGD